MTAPQASRLAGSRLLVEDRLEHRFLDAGVGLVGCISENRIPLPQRGARLSVILLDHIEDSLPIGAQFLAMRLPSPEPRERGRELLDVVRNEKPSFRPAPTFA